MTEPAPHPIVQDRIDTARAQGRRMATGTVLLRRTDREALGLAEGALFCSWCGTSPLPSRRRTWCSDECVQAFLVRSDMSTVRRRLEERDNGVCCVCGLDCEAKFRHYSGALRDFFNQHKQYNYPEKGQRFQLPRDTPEWTRFKQEWGVWHTTYPNTFWEADHIVPVAEGGGICSLENYRTLCVQCHRRETAELARRLGPKRAAANAIRRSAEEAWRDRTAGQMRLEV